MAHVFISYSKQDHVYVNALVDALSARGFDVWIDDHRLQSSEDWWRSIVTALWNCDACIVVLSRHSDASRWVQREITIADGRGKPMFPLLLEGDINTPNWSIFVRTQYTDVRNGQMPPPDFFDALAWHSPRKVGHGAVIRSVAPAGHHPDDEAFATAVENPPDTYLPKRRPIPVLPIALALVVFVVAVLLTLSLLNSRETPATLTPSVGVTDVAGLTGSPSVSDAIIENIDPLNEWRSENGYPPLVPSDVLNQLALDHLSDLANRPLSDLGNVYRRDDQDIQEFADAAQYGGRVQMYVEVSQNEVTLNSVLRRLETLSQSVPDIADYTDYGLAVERRIATNMLYFVLILGKPG